MLTPLLNKFQFSKQKWEYNEHLLNEILVQVHVLTSILVTDSVTSGHLGNEKTETYRSSKLPMVGLQCEPRYVYLFKSSFSLLSTVVSQEP